MPEAVVFHYQGKAHTVYFSGRKAMLPVQSRYGELQLVTWGRRQQEESEMPLGGWARLDSIHNGKWDHYLPKPVRLPIEKFMKMDYEGRTHWYEVVKGQWIQGLLAREGEEYRVYIVTIIPELLDICHDRWPRIIVG
ncbi:MAG: hypothetical protein EPO11_03490 [Gammaproteobacteria bacterium]|nr:MAG: hypothetical protein EPO11_03490 [Gammaproteobacteria bacterium]